MSRSLRAAWRWLNSDAGMSAPVRRLCGVGGVIGLLAVWLDQLIAADVVLVLTIVGALWLDRQVKMRG